MEKKGLEHTGSGTYFVISYNGSEWSLEMLEGSMDLNALWFSDGDTIKEGDTTLVKQESSLNMNGSGSYDVEGNLITWDDVEVLSLSGLGKEGTDKPTYLTEGETFDISEYIDYDGDLADLTIGVRATSVSGSDSLKLNAEAVEGEPVAGEGGRIFVASEAYTGIFAYFDTNNNGKLDISEVSGSYLWQNSDVDFSSGSYIIEFIGKSARGTSETVLNLTGFTADDSIVVNFTRDWVGTGFPIAAAGGLQRGSSSNAFPGYTFNSYTSRVSSANAAVRYQQKVDYGVFYTFSSDYGFSSAYSATIAELRVGVTIQPAALSARFTNYTDEGGQFIGGAVTRQASYQRLRLASWSAGTTIGANQISVVWPDALGVN